MYERTIVSECTIHFMRIMSLILYYTLVRCAALQLFVVRGPGVRAVRRRRRRCGGVHWHNIQDTCLLAAPARTQRNFLRRIAVARQIVHIKGKYIMTTINANIVRCRARVVSSLFAPTVPPHTRSRSVCALCWCVALQWVRCIRARVLLNMIRVLRSVTIQLLFRCRVCALSS